MVIRRSLGALARGTQIVVLMVVLFADRKSVV